MRRFIVLLLIVALPIAAMATPTQETAIDPETLEVQLIPSRDAAYLDAQRLPLQTMLEEKLGMDVNVTVATDYNALIEGMASEQIHVGLLATMSYVLAADEGYAEAILKSLRYDVDDFGEWMTDQPLVAGYKSQLIVAADSGIESVADLAGKKIAISSFTSTSGFVWPANLLADNDLDPERDVEWLNAGGHDNAVLAVYNGDADAAFTFKDARTLFRDESFFDDLMEEVILVANTTEIPNDTISVIPNLDEGLKDRISAGFIAVVEDPVGFEILQKIYNHFGYAPASDSDYDGVRVYLERMNEWDF